MYTSKNIKLNIIEKVVAIDNIGHTTVKIIQGKFASHKHCMHMLQAYLQTTDSRAYLIIVKQQKQNQHPVQRSF